jgi:hypothetical protein
MTDAISLDELEQQIARCQIAGNEPAIVALEELALSAGVRISYARVQEHIFRIRRERQRAQWRQRHGQQVAGILDLIERARDDEERYADLLTMVEPLVRGGSITSAIYRELSEDYATLWGNLLDELDVE